MRTVFLTSGREYENTVLKQSAVLFLEAPMSAVVPDSAVAARSTVPARSTERLREDRRAHAVPVRSTGTLLALAGIFAAAGGGVLSAVFAWPARLDDRAPTALPAFAEAAGAIRFGFYLELLSSLVFVAAALALPQVVGRSTATRVLTGFGVAGGLMQVLGWVRWPLAVPVLARDYLAAAPGSLERAATGASYDLLNAYAGGALGEHLGWLLQGIWAVGLGVLIARRRLLPLGLAVVGPALTVCWLPLVLAAGLTASHTNGVATIGSLAYTVWFLWLAVAGVVLAVRGTRVMAAFAGSTNPAEVPRLDRAITGPSGLSNVDDMAGPSLR
jgi:hypothetical protein